MINQRLLSRIGGILLVGVTLRWRRRRILMWRVLLILLWGISLIMGMRRRRVTWICMILLLLLILLIWMLGVIALIFLLRIVRVLRSDLDRVGLIIWRIL